MGPGVYVWMGTAVYGTRCICMDGDCCVLYMYGWGLLCMGPGVYVCMGTAVLMAHK